MFQRGISSHAFKEYGKNIIDNAQASLQADLSDRGIEIVSGGTDNHLMLVDLVRQGCLQEKRLRNALMQLHITCNKNTIPNDPQTPFVTSGIRLGTAAVTTRGMNTEDMDVIADAIAMLINDVDANKAKAMELVKTLTSKYPLYE